MSAKKALQILSLKKESPCVSSLVYMEKSSLDPVLFPGESFGLNVGLPITSKLHEIRVLRGLDS